MKETTRPSLLLSTVTVVGLLLTSHNSFSCPTDQPDVGTICEVISVTPCPKGYAETGGQLLDISKYKALFTLIGTKYGGDGETTFALPFIPDDEYTKSCIAINGKLPKK